MLPKYKQIHKTSMKKGYLLLLCTFLYFAAANAQYKKHEIEIGIGIWNLNEVTNIASTITVPSVPTGTMMEGGKSFGSIHVNYKYRLHERISAGGTFAYDYSSANAVLNHYPIGSFNMTHYTLAAEADYTYLNFKYFKMYALAGIGGTLYDMDYMDGVNSNKDDDNTSLHFTFQLTPIGLKFGDTFGGFLEIGFGYRGIFNAGLFIRL